MLNKRIKKDNLGRRTDRVKRREINEISKLHAQGLTVKEIASEVKRKPETVKRHMGSLQSAQQVRHISDLQKLAKEFLDSLVYPADTEDWDDLHQTQYALWQAFKRLIGDARWPMLAAHLGDFADDFKNMAVKLEPMILIEPRKNRAETRKKINEPTAIMHRIDDPVLLGSHKMPDKIEVYLISMDELVNVIREAHTLKSKSHLDIIVEEKDTQEWERHGLKQRCSWCSNKN
jgi:hypothetical protein